MLVTCHGQDLRPGCLPQPRGSPALTPTVPVPGERSLVWLVERDRGRLCRNRFILLKPRGSSASDMVSSDSAEAKESLAWSARPGWEPCECRELLVCKGTAGR